MNRTEIETTVRQVLEAALSRSIAPAEDVSRRNEKVWDSIKQIEILFMLEEALGIRFAEAELDKLDSISGIVERASKHFDIG